MKTSAEIRIKGDSTEVSFEWRDFDGDDCFNDFHINVITETGTRRFDFGGVPSTAFDNSAGSLGTRRRTRSAEASATPIRYYDLYREKDGYRLVVRFEGSGLCEEFCFRNPRTQIDDEFMRTVYSG